ncbi:MAG: c-type cytochrome [Burkholderiales bacterium]|nr:MAG: c-type cytochrome [Burkholderiales bacterium]
MRSRARFAARAALVAALAVLGWLAATPARTQTGTPGGQQVYESACVGCHATGVAGAPRFGDAAQWAVRLAAGHEQVYRNAIAGTERGMPPKGGRTDLSDAAIRSAVDYMLAAAGAPAREPAAASNAAPAPAAAPVPAAATAAGTASAPSAPSASSGPTAPAAGAGAVAGGAVADVNAFNRLLKPPGRHNLPAAESGIHDPANDGTHALQPPALAFAMLPKSLAGNRVDWVGSLEDGKIDPRWDRADPAAAPVVLDLNIVREVKGSMPDVVYPHKEHTQWLDCANCHPAIFVPQKGANQISMAAILLGQKCGVCHGKVAFPVSECRLCHSRKKDAMAATAGTGTR